LEFKVTVLGTSSATFAYGRHQSATLVSFDNYLFLVDCGEGTQMQLIEHKAKIAKLTAIFITHLHGDHYLGLLGFLGTLSMGGRKKALTVFGPVGLKEIIEVQFKHSGTILNFELTIEEHQSEVPTTITTYSFLKVSTIPLQHRIPCVGYLFEEVIVKRTFRSDKNLEVLPKAAILALKDGLNYLDPISGEEFLATDWLNDFRPTRKFAYCSDTIYLPEVYKLFMGADLLYHEATFGKEHAQRAKETFHCTAGQAATQAKNAQVGKLIISHFSSRYKDIEPLVMEARTIFPNTEAAIEGREYNLPVIREALMDNNLESQ